MGDGLLFPPGAAVRAGKCPLKEVKISKDCVLGSQAFGKDVKIKYYH